MLGLISPSLRTKATGQINCPSKLELCMTKTTIGRNQPPLVVTRVDPKQARRKRLLWLAAWLLSLALMYAVCRIWLIPGAGPTSADLVDLRETHELLKNEFSLSQDEVSNQKRAREVAEQALEDLRLVLTQRQDEVASLRADVSFYQRLIEGGAQQAGQWIHQFRLVRDGDSGNMYRYRLTLAQNLKRGRSAEGTIQLAVTGSRNGALEKLDLDALTGADATPTTEYSFKYFQQLEGTILLPEAFEPSAIELAMRPKDGASTVRREFTWAEANQKDEDS